MNDRQTEEKRKLAAYSSVGMMFPASIAVGLAIGYFLDRWLNTSPYLMIAFTLYGVGAGFWNLLKLGKTKSHGPNDPKEQVNEVFSQMLNVKRVLKFAALLLLISLILIYVFSKEINYSIIFGSGFIISVTGYIVMIRLIDRCLKQGRGQWLFFAAALLKMTAIAGGFYLASRISKTAVLIYILGLSVIVLAIMAEALYKLYRSMFKWKNTN